MSESVLSDLAQQLGLLLKKKAWQVVTAESCTGGLLGQLITSIPGSSQWYDRGFITYSNQAKQSMLGVPEGTLQKCGAVSRQTVKAMALGALENSLAQCAVSVSGIAGPGGGIVEKPVGTVLLGWAVAERVSSEAFLFKGERSEIRQQAAYEALAGLIQRLRT